MSTNAQLYLSRMETLAANPKTHQKVKHINSTLLDDIGNEIIQSRIVIPQHEKKLKLKPVVDQHECDLAKIDGKYNEIMLKKKILLEQLDAVQMMQSKIKINMLTLKQSTVSTHILKKPKFKSQFTQQQVTRIKEIYKSQKNFKHKLQQRIKKYEQDLHEYKKQKEQQEKQKHRRLCMQKHEQRQKYIKKIEQRNKLRQQTLKEQREKIAELQSKQKLFQRLEQSFLKQKQLQSQEAKRKLDEHKKQRELSFDDVKRHQQQYMERKRVKDQQRQQNIKNFKDINEKKFPCLFLDKVKEQQERATLEQQERQEMVKNFVQRKTAYAQEVRKQLHNKINAMSQSKLSPAKQLKLSAVVQLKTQPKWLNTPQKYHQGTKYMREINSKLSKLPKKIPQISQDHNKPRFKNYLVELKNQDQQKKREAKQKLVGNFVNTVGIIAAKENITSTNLAKSVKAKLQLMCKLQNLKG